MIKKPIIWVIWGMWPYASLRCYELFLNESKRYSGGIKNSDFPHVILDSIPVKELTNSERDLDETLNYVKSEYIRLLESWVNIFIMPCNTMHLYYEKIFINKNDITNLSLIDETINQVNLDWHKIVGILWSITTIKSNLYSNTLNDIWILPVTIDDNSTLDKINNIIKKVIWWDKITNDDKDVLKNSLSILKTKWATAVILWCTELPIAFNLIDTNIKLYDPLIITIRKACNKYYNNK